MRVRIFGVGGFVGPLTDPEIRAEAGRIVDAEVPLHADAKDLRAERVPGGVRVTWDGGSETFQYALAATGRVPNVDNLGLENTGLVLDRRGVPVYDPRTLQCGDSGIFVAGDANADAPLLHEAADEGRIAGECGTKTAPRDGVVEIGYGLAAPSRGRGLGSAAVGELVDWLVARRDVKAIEAEIHESNAPSRRVVERLGFTVSAGPVDGYLRYWRSAE